MNPRLQDQKLILHFSWLGNFSSLKYPWILLKVEVRHPIKPSPTQESNNVTDVASTWLQGGQTHPWN